MKTRKVLLAYLSAFFASFYINEKIMRNNFKLDRERIIIEEARKHLAAFRIQTYYRNALVNPNTRIGWNKGMSDFKFMQDHLNNQN